MIAPMREKLGDVPMRAAIGCVDLVRLDAGANQLQPTGGRQIDMPFAIAIVSNRCLRIEYFFKFRQHFRSDFKRIEADARPDCRNQLSGIHSSDLFQFGNRCTDHTPHRPAPARVNGGDRATIRCGQQNRTTVRHSNRQNITRLACHQRIPLAAVGKIRTVDDRHPIAVNLMQIKSRPIFASAGLHQQSIILSDPIRLILHGAPVGIPQIHRIKRRRTDPANPRAERVRDPSRFQKRRRIINNPTRTCSADQSHLRQVIADDRREMYIR